MSKRLILCCLMAVVVAISNTAADASFIVYTDRTAFENAGGPTIVDPFDNFIDSSLSITFDSGVVSTASSVPFFQDNLVESGWYFNGVDPSGINAAETTTWTFPTAITAFGFDTAGANIGELSIRGNFDGLGDEQIDVRETVGGNLGFDFLGVIGTSPFTEIEFFSRGSRAELYVIDNLAFNNAEIAAVPEPSTRALVTVAGLGIGGYQLRRRRVNQQAKI